MSNDVLDRVLSSDFVRRFWNFHEARGKYRKYNFLNYLSFAFVLILLYLARSVIGLEDSCYFDNQSEVKTKPIVTCSRVFSRACHRSLTFIWFQPRFQGPLSSSLEGGREGTLGTKLIWFEFWLVHCDVTSVRIGQSESFSFGLRHSIENHSLIKTVNK